MNIEYLVIIAAFLGVPIAIIGLTIQFLSFRKQTRDLQKRVNIIEMLQTTNNYEAEIIQINHYDKVLGKNEIKKIAGQSVSRKQK